VSAPRSYDQVTVNVPVERRGVMPLESFELRTATRSAGFAPGPTCKHRLTAFVAPRPRGDQPPLPSPRPVGRPAPRARRAAMRIFAGLRAYAPGVPLKHMAWKVLARGGEAAVRSYTGLAAQPEWLEWSALEGLDTEARLSQLCRWVLA
jgi:uncharacterized protein (DUF58 family)